MGCLIRSLLVLVLVAAFAYLVLLILGNDSGSSAEFEVSTGFEMAGRGEVVVAPTIAPTSIPSTSIATATPLPTWTPVPPWPDGGTLHQASLDEWFRATDANRLATAGGWIVAADEQAAFNTDNLHVEADVLVTCIRDTAPTTPAAWQASELATICLSQVAAPLRMSADTSSLAITNTSDPARSQPDFIASSGGSAATSVPENAVVAQVTSIIDGDTIDVRINGQEFRVRYIGIDTPERGQPGYAAATADNSSLVQGQNVYLVQEVSNTDRYGRLLRHVYLANGIWVNKQLVAEGVAQPVRYEPDTAHAAELEQAAIGAVMAGAGFWQGGPDAMSYARANRDVTIHTGPGTGFAPSGLALANSTFTVFGRSQDATWVQVRASDRTGGWVYVEHLSINVPVTSIPVSQEISQLAVPVALGKNSAVDVSIPVGGSEPFVCIGGCATPPNPSCNIKGNVNSSQVRIYHAPGFRDYERTDIKLDEGDRWFCTEQEAINAGFRAPKNQ